MLTCRGCFLDGRELLHSPSLLVLAAVYAYSSNTRSVHCSAPLSQLPCAIPRCSKYPLSQHCAAKYWHGLTYFTQNRQKVPVQEPRPETGPVSGGATSVAAIQAQSTNYAPVSIASRFSMAAYRLGGQRVLLRMNCRSAHSGSRSTARSSCSSARSPSPCTHRQAAIHHWQPHGGVCVCVCVTRSCRVHCRVTAPHVQAGRPPTIPPATS